MISDFINGVEQLWQLSSIAMKQVADRSQLQTTRDQFYIVVYFLNIYIAAVINLIDEGFVPVHWNVCHAWVALDLKRHVAGNLRSDSGDKQRVKNNRRVNATSDIIAHLALTFLVALQSSNNQAKEYFISTQNFAWSG